ncbi:MAG: class I tRNA ligase family protein, partial [Mameliella sp.]|nr:class I tRNA ligase family protein [Phaeodactylibacter sp.]
IHPFNDVYFTGMVRDKDRRKMSKSLGNSPDALKLIENYGADGVRFAMLSSAAAGNDIVFDAPFNAETKEVLNESKLCEQGRNFCNKMWNALRLVKGWEVKAGESDAINRLAIEWMEQRLNETIEKLSQQYDQYRLSDALMMLYKLVWDDFCSWYLEMIKPAYGEPIDSKTLEASLSIYERLMTLLHPFMPFITEEIWHNLRERKDGEDCVISPYPVAGTVDKGLIDRIEQAKTIVTSVRETRNSKGVKMKDELALFVQDGNSSRALFDLSGLREMLIKMANLSGLDFTSEDVANSVSFLSGKTKFFLELNQEIDLEAECKKLKEELEYQKGFVASVEKKLSNERFVNNAPAPVVERERKKLEDGQAKVKNLEEQLASMGCQ